MSRCLWLIVTSFLVFGFVSCSKQEAKEQGSSGSVSVWHFWSEPAQKAAFEELVADFEKENPNISIDLTELSWSDGKTKIDAAFNSNSAPDVLQMGLEWVDEYSEAKVLEAIPDSLILFTPRTMYNNIKHKGKTFAVPFTMNTRALFFNNAVMTHAKDISQYTFNDLYADGYFYHKPEKKQFGFGINAAEPHNVSKKTIPFMWAHGSDAFRELPLHRSLDTESVIGLDYVCKLASRSIIAPSRELDERFRKGEIGVIMSGMWMLNSKDNDTAFCVQPLSIVHKEDVKNKIRDQKVSNILSGDCFSISATSSKKKAALKFIEFCRRFETAKKFCKTVPDAGFPAHVRTYGDEYFTAQANMRSFVTQLEAARPVVSVSYYAEAEKILEDHIMQAIYKKMSPDSAIASAREQIRLLEIEKSNKKK